MIKMILTRDVKIKISNKWLVKKYKDRGFENVCVNDEILVPVNILPIQQRVKILVKCDLCGSEREILYSTYMDSTKNNTEIYVCRGKCANVKREETNMKLYNVKNCFQSEEKKKKIKETYMNLYGVDHNMKIKECREKSIETLKKKYGCENPSQSEIIKKKKTETCQKNYGVDYPFQSEINLEKSYKTNYKKYDTKTGSQNPLIQEKIVNTQGKIEKYKDTDLFYQCSYELDFLNNFYDKFEIKRNLHINYKHLDENKIYYPDYYLPKFNLIIEIKSNYSLKKELDKNISKQKACIDHGYNFMFVVDKNYDEFIQFVKYQ